MVQALQRRYASASSTSAESVGEPLAGFSLDSELLTSNNVLVPTGKRHEDEQQKRWTQRQQSSGSFTMIAGQVIPFPGLSESAIGIIEGDIEDEFSADHYRNLLVKATRRVVFSEEVSLRPSVMRRLQPKIILDERYFSRDDD